MGYVIFAAAILILTLVKIDRVIVVAVSAGGPSALQFTHDFPNRTSALVLFSAQSKYRPPQNTLFVRIIMRIVNATIMRSDFLFWVVAKTFQSKFLGLIGIPNEVYKDLTAEQKKLAQQTIDSMHPMSMRTIGTSHEIGIRPLDSTSMKEISAPTLILHAKDDRMVAYEHAEYAHRNIKQSKLFLFETGGYGLLPQLKSVREQVNDFLKELGLNR